MSRIRRRAQLSLLLILLAAFGWSCDQGRPTAPSPVNVSVVLAPGETAEIAGTDFSLLFLRVVSDSRCPADANCVQVGEALLAVEVWAGGRASGGYQLSTAPRAAGRARHGDLAIELLQLDPYPFSAKPIAPSDYRARFAVTRQ